MAVLSVPIAIVVFGAVVYLKRRGSLTVWRAAALMGLAVFAVFYSNELSFGANALQALASSLIVGALGAAFGYAVAARTIGK